MVLAPLSNIVEVRVFLSATRYANSTLAVSNVKKKKKTTQSQQQRNKTGALAWPDTGRLVLQIRWQAQQKDYCYIVLYVVSYSNSPSSSN